MMIKEFKDIYTKAFTCENAFNRRNTFDREKQKRKQRQQEKSGWILTK